MAATVQRATGSGYRAMSASYVVLSTPHSRWNTVRLFRDGGPRTGPPGPPRSSPPGPAGVLGDYLGGPRSGPPGPPRSSPPGPAGVLLDIALPSHALDHRLAEDAVRANHQGHDHEHVRGEVLGAAPHVGVDVAGGHALDDSHD